MSILVVDVTATGSPGISQASERQILKRMLADIAHAIGEGPTATSGTANANDGTAGATWTYVPSDASWK